MGAVARTNWMICRNFVSWFRQCSRGETHTAALAAEYSGNDGI